MTAPVPSPWIVRDTISIVIDVAAPGFVKPDSPSVHREAHAIEGGTIVLAVGAAPGKPFEVSEWEARQHALGREA